MACNWVLTPQQINPPKNGTPSSPKLFKAPPPAPSPQTFDSRLRLETKKHEDVRLMHKPLIQHNCQQIKKQNKSEEIQFLLAYMF